MKKIITLILVLLMCVPLVACEKAEADNLADMAQEQLMSGTERETETKAPDQAPSWDTEETDKATEKETGGDIEESFEAVTTPAEEPVAGFNKRWGGTGVEMPIPEPPFAYETSVRSNGVKISSTNGGVDGDVTHSMILAYCKTLKDIGYNKDVVENVIGTRYGRTCYEFKASNGNNSSVELVDDGGGVVIFVYFPVASGSGT